MFVPFPEIQSNLSSLSSLFELQLIHDPWAAVGDRVLMLRGFFLFLSLFFPSFAAFLFPAFFAMIRSLVAYYLRIFLQSSLFLCRITNSFSCHIQLSVRIAIRPPPHTALDPWDSPPSRNCPVVFLSGMLTGLLLTGACRLFHFFSRCTYILADHFGFVNTFFYFLVIFFPESYCLREAKGAGNRDIIGYEGFLCLS